MPFSILTIRTMLQTCFGVPPQTVTLCTDFRLHLHLTDTEIRKLLTEVTICTGLSFSPNTAEHLTDVVDLLTHVILRLHEDGDTAYYFGSIPDKLAQRMSANEYRLKLVAYAAVHPN